MSEPTTPALECDNVTVTYGDVVALRAVSLGFESGKIHAVVGQNGAGKTTFARAAAGIVRPSAGVVRIGGQAVPAGDVKAARRAGVEIVHQSFALPPSFTVAEAMEFGASGGWGVFSRRAVEGRWREHLRSLEVTVDPHRRIRDLPVETQQGVEIARALVTDAKVLILDEPTAVLSPSGIDLLFARVRSLKAMGVTIILILHKIREVLAVADTLTVLRGGSLVAGPMPRDQVDAMALSEMIIGPAAAASLSAEDAEAVTGRRSAPAAHGGHGPGARAPVLELRDVSTRADSEGPALAAASLSVGRGEIVGVAGVEGNGQRTLVRAIADLADRANGAILLDGKDVTASSLLERRNLGLRVIPFERNSEGLSLSSSLWENWSARTLLRTGLLRAINPGGLRRACEGALKKWGVVFATSGQRAGSLSGGNAQKLILAREIDEDARLIIAAQPTRGLDVGATAFVWQALREARDRGCGVLLISSDLDELFDISDRLIVVLSGHVAGSFEPPYDLAAVGSAMTGAV